jgi:hypothetical protein
MRCDRKSVRTDAPAFLILYLQPPIHVLPTQQNSSGNASGRLSVVGLTRRGPPTCRQRREWLWRAEENSRRNRIPSHLTLRAKVGGARRVSPSIFPSKIKIQHSSIDNSFSATPFPPDAAPPLFKRGNTTFSHQMM